MRLRVPTRDLHGYFFLVKKLGNPSLSNRWLFYFNIGWKNWKKTEFLKTKSQFFENLETKTQFFLSFSVSRLVQSPPDGLKTVEKNKNSVLSSFWFFFFSTEVSKKKPSAWKKLSFWKVSVKISTTNLISLDVATKL